MAKPVVFLGMPHTGTMTSGAAKGYYLWPTDGRLHVLYGEQSTSLPHYNLNWLWQTALWMRDHPEDGRPPVTHFAMIHSDVAPPAYWLDTQYGELIAHDADIVGQAIRLKDDSGLTSLGVNDPLNDFAPRRLHIAEVHALPLTFCAADIAPGQCLLLNTGLFICDLRKPWCDSFVFNFECRIVTARDGKKDIEVTSEDWNLSRHIYRAGGKLYATNATPVGHEGVREYRSDVIEGTMNGTDEAYEAISTPRVILKRTRKREAAGAP